MEFLQRSTHLAPTERDDRLILRSREKEKRKAERAHDEISSFFQRTDPTLFKTTPDIPYRRSPTYVSDYLVTHAQLQSSDFGKTSYLGFGPPGPSAHSSLAPSRHAAPQSWLENEPETNSRSRRATTYVTWSETHVSPQGTSRIERPSDHQGPISPIPDSIHISMENTGIFRDTGIIMVTGKHRSGEKVSQDYAQFNRSPNVAKDSRTGILTSARSTSSRAPENLTDYSNSRDNNYLPKNFLRDHDIMPRGTISQPTETAAATVTGSGESSECPRAITKQCNGDPDWSQGQASKVVEKTMPSPTESFTPPPESKSVPIDREELARKARIKRPSTTLPVTRITEERSLAANRPRVIDDPNSAIATSEYPSMAPGHSGTLAEPGRLSERDTAFDPTLQAHQGKQKIDGSSARNDVCQDSLKSPNMVQSPVMASLEEQTIQDASTERLRLSQWQSVTEDNRDDAQEQSMRSDIDKVNRNLPDLPFRGGSWINCRWGSMSASHAQLLPMTEVTPLYLRQMQRNDILKEGPHASSDKYVEENSYLQMAGHPFETVERISPDLEDLGVEVLPDEDEGDEVLSQNQYLEGNYEDFDIYTEKDGGPPESWLLDGYSRMRGRENYTVFPCLDLSISSLSGAQDNVGIRSFVPLGGAKQDCQEYIGQDDISTVGFWRPNCQY